MRRRWLMLAEILLLAALCVWLALALVHRRQEQPANSIDLKIPLAGARDRAFLLQNEQGWFYYRITLDSGQVVDLNPQDFAQRVYDEKHSRSSWETLLNITTPWGLAWVGIGFMGQVLFTGRMLVQWLVSEKAKKSVVPPVFWWMSLIGSTMLLVYFFWRMDPVGILGQAFGWFIYVRNLWLIYRPHPDATTTENADAAESVK